MTNSINTNISAYFAQANIAKASSAAQTSVARLSSGNFITKAADDVARLSIGTSFSTTVRTLRQALVNASQGVSLLQVADGALGQVTEILQRQKTLAVQASSGNLSASDRGFLDQEFQALTQQIDFISKTTSFNGVGLLDGSLSTSSRIDDSTNQAKAGAASISLSSNLVATPTADTITIAGITFTAATSISGSQDFLIGATTADTIKNLADKLTALSSSNASVTVGGVATTYAQALGKATFTADNSTLQINSRTGGSLGNNFTVDISGVASSKASAAGAFGGTTLNLFADSDTGTGGNQTPFTSSTTTITASSPSAVTAPFKVGDDLTVQVGQSTAQTIYTFRAGDGLDDVISGINARSKATGISASLIGDSTNGYNIQLKLNQVTGNNISVNGGTGFYRATDGTAFVKFNGATSSTNLFSTAFAAALAGPTTAIVGTQSNTVPFAASSRIYASVGGNDYVDISGLLATGDTSTTIMNKINASSGANQLGIVATLSGNNIALRFNDTARTGAISFYSGTSASSNDITAQTAYSTDALGQAQGFGFGGSYIKTNLLQTGVLAPDTSVTAANTAAQTADHPITQGTTITYRLNETAGASTDLAITVAAGNTLRDIAATINSTAGFVSRGIKASVVVDSSNRYNIQLTQAASSVPPAGTAVGNLTVTNGIRIEYADANFGAGYNPTVALSNVNGAAAQTTYTTYRLFNTAAAGHLGVGASVVAASEAASTVSSPLVAGGTLVAYDGTTSRDLLGGGTLTSGDTLATIVNTINTNTGTSGFSAELDASGTNILLHNKVPATSLIAANASVFFGSDKAYEGQIANPTLSTFTADLSLNGTQGIFNNSYTTVSLFGAALTSATYNMDLVGTTAAAPLSASTNMTIAVTRGATVSNITIAVGASMTTGQLINAINDNATAQATGVRAQLNNVSGSGTNITLYIADYNSAGSGTFSVTTTAASGSIGLSGASALTNQATASVTVNNSLLQKAYGYGATTIATPTGLSSQTTFGLAGGADTGLGYGTVSASGGISDPLVTGLSQTAARVSITYADTAASDLVATFANQTVTVAGQAFTFAASPASATEIGIGSSMQETLDNAVATITRFGKETAAGDTAYQLNQITASRSGNALVFTGKGISTVTKLDGTASAGIASTVTAASVSAAGSLSNASRSGASPSYGVDVSAVSNAAFSGTIQGFKATYAGTADTVNASVKIGDNTYTATNVSTNNTSNQTVRFYSDTVTNSDGKEISGGYFDVQLAANHGVVVDNDTDAGTFATRLNAAFQGLNFSQDRVISSFHGTDAIINPSGINIGSLVGASVHAQLPSFDANKLTDIEVHAAPPGSADAKISLTIDGNQYNSGTIGTKLGANQTYRLTSATDPNFFVDFTTGDNTIDLSSADNAQAVQKALSTAFGVSAGSAALSFQIGTKSSESLGVNIGAATADSLFSGKSLSITTLENASLASAALDTALSTVTSIRANVGALQSRFNFASANIQISVQNQDASRSELLDTDIASESTSYATAQVKMQAGISVLAQANQQLQSLLKLLG